MRARYLILGLALAVAPVGAAAQQSDAAGRIEAALSAATRADIPVSLIQSKVNEGRAKGIAEARIAAAVEARLDALVRAQGALARGRASNVSAGELSIAADALQAGVAENAMVDVMTRAPAQRRAVATAVLTELVELGVASEVALARVHAAIGQGGEALVNLPAQASGNARGHGRGGVRVNVGPPAEVDAGVHGNVDLRGNRGNGNGPPNDD